MRTLFDEIRETQFQDWLPDTPPCLDGIHEVYLNFETTGLRWFDGDRPIACSIFAGDKSYYLSWGHNGGNLDESTVKRWAQRELRNKRITNVNTRFDIHMGRVWGIDLEAQGNEVSDVSHYAALLDDSRRRFRVDELIQDYLDEIPMTRIDESQMAQYHASEAAPRSKYGVKAIKRLKDAMWPQLTAENLHGVRALEDKVIYTVCEMEKNGSPIDQELLERWVKESKIQLDRVLMTIAKELGWICNPRSPGDMSKAFRQLNLKIDHTSSGRDSFTDYVLDAVEHPIIKLIRKARKLSNLRSKFLVGTQTAIGSDGILRYALHQLRAAKDDNADAGEAGTVTGRFSSSEIAPGVGCNIQQRMKGARQRIAFGYDENDTSHDNEIFLVRKLHVASAGMHLLTSDLDQAQYRIFASYANNPEIIEAYRRDVHTSFHKLMHAKISPFADLSYRQQKDLNFAVLFGAGLTKMGLMLGHISAAEFEEIRATRNFNHPKLARTKEVKRIYDREVPEVSDLLAEASHLAKPRCDSSCKRGDDLHKRLSHRGYVKTVLGRRSRFPEGHRLHKAFNSVDQGTEADVMKTKLVELHERRHETGLILRITNHDEVVGDIADLRSAQKVHDILSVQSFPQLRVPLTWSTEIGPDWASGKGIHET